MDDFIFIPHFSNIDSAIEYLKNHGLLGHKFSSNLSRFTPEKDLLNWVVCAKVISTIEGAYKFDGNFYWSGNLQIEAGGISQLNPYTTFTFTYESYGKNLKIKTNYRPIDIQGNDVRGISKMVAYYKRCTDVFANMFGLYCARYGDSKGQIMLNRINEILAIE